MLLSVLVKFVLYLLREKNENKQKEAGFDPFLITLRTAYHLGRYICSSPPTKEIGAGRRMYCERSRKERKRERESDCAIHKTMKNWVK